MKDIIWKIEKWKVKDLIPADYNPRKLSDKARADLQESVNRFGQVEPLAANTNGTLIGGHQRIKIYADLGIKETMVMIPSRKLSVKEEKELNIRLNKNVGEWDWEKVKKFFGVDELIGAGFEQDELKVWLGLEDANNQEIDEERMQILMVYPPEAPNLKERVALRFKDKGEYDQVKKWLEKNGNEAILALIKMSAK